MLIEIAVTNFRSIKDRQVFSMMPSGKIKPDELSDNVIPGESNPYKISLLKSSIFYGANASGKSNFLRAIKAIEYLVKNSIDYKLDERIEPYEPFKLNEMNKRQSVEFEIDFIAKDNIRYLYKIIFNATEFIHESLYSYPQGKKTKLFIREKNSPISYGDYFKGERKQQLLNNQLLLSKAGTSPIESLKEAYLFFAKYLFCNIFVDSKFDDKVISNYTKIIAEKKKDYLFKNFNKLLALADTGIDSFTIKEFSPNEFEFPADFPDDVKKRILEDNKYGIKTIHKLYRNEGIIGEEAFELDDESAGTKKLIGVGTLILDALFDGSTIIIDELDKSLHPLLTRMLIKLFHSPKTNPYQAQLIFATHDISLIDISLFRRDQIWFTEKDDYGATQIYPLSDFTGISKVKPLENWYLRGRFGGVPVLGDFDLDLEFPDENEKS